MKNIVEVWPWYWALTEKILEKKPKSLTLVELDQDMINILNERIKSWELKIQNGEVKNKISLSTEGFIPLDNSNFQIKNIDILKYTPDFEDYIVIANIPYYITSPILRRFLYDIEDTPEKMLILMQKDVGDKILQWQLWDDEKVKSSVLSLFVSKKCNVEEVLFVWKENFEPSPKVESSVLLFEAHNLYKEVDDNVFLDIIKKWFSSPRKKLVKNLVMWGFKKKRFYLFLMN